MSLIPLIRLHAMELCFTSVLFLFFLVQTSVLFLIINNDTNQKIAPANN